MKHTLLILLLIAACCPAQAQSKRNIYVDIVIGHPGFSATYTKTLSRHFDVGGGVNSNYFTDRTYANSRSAAFLDLRPHWGAKKSLFFLFGDAGLGITAGPQAELATYKPLGFFAAFGPGYCYRINKRGMGPYLSMGLYGYTTRYRYKYPQPPPTPRDNSHFDATGIISVGFKF